jgi:predicted butyrate kinase (DUF1464 family)
MTRVIGIDPGTLSIDLCGMEDGRVFLDRSLPTSEALADPDAFLSLLQQAGPLDLIAGPSGYGLPVVAATEVAEEDLRLAFLAAEGETGGIGGLRAVVRTLARSSLPVVFTPAVIHLSSVPEHRKVNRVDMGTADKVAVAALAIDRQSSREARALTDVSLLLVEIGGAFTATLAVAGGRIVDGIGGTSGPLGFRSAGAWDGEVAFLAGAVTKGSLFGGGAVTVAGWEDSTASPDRFATPATSRERVAWEALIEGVTKAVHALRAIVPSPREIVLSGRLAHVSSVRRALHERLGAIAPVRLLEGFASEAKEGAQGAALIADGLAGGSHRDLVRVMGLREAHGTVLDHLYVISRAAARRHLGLS